MVGYLKERLFPLLIAFSALSVSVSAAFYSVSGLSKLFAGAAFAVIVMAASLEIAKLVIASLLYQYRKNLPKFLKWYLSMACVVLILITSMGIYGFLSAAYQETAAKAGSIDSQITLIEVKRDNIKEQLAVYNEEKSSINSAVADLRTGLSNNKIQYTDTLGNVITTTSRATRNALTKQLDQAIDRQTIINSKVDDLNQKLFDYETEIVEVKLSDAVSSELGPLKYLSGLTGLPMDRIINYLLLTIIFVFDPLAIALVVAANFAFDQIRPRTKENLYGEKVEIKEKPIVEITEEDLEADLKYGHEDEERMDVIGQNGNDGLHYEEEIAEIDSADLPEDLQWVNKKEETYAEGGYMQSETPKQLPLSFAQEAAEINRIMGKDLTLEQMKRLKDSKLTRTFDDDDLKIHY
jgi:Skp family chaperone for outer membrane proteins